jgi:hypothetical protein
MEGWSALRASWSIGKMADSQGFTPTTDTRNRLPKLYKLQGCPMTEVAFQSVGMFIQFLWQISPRGMKNLSFGE